MIVDCNATLGNWPFRRLRDSDPASFVALLDRVGIAQSWVSCFEGVFYHAVQEGNEQLAAGLSGLEARLVHVPVLNPNYPGWQDDLAECLQWSVPGYRLYPSYHDYGLADARVTEVATAVAATGRFLQIVVRMEDERMHHRLARVAPVDLAPLPALAREFPGTSFMVLNASNIEITRSGGDAAGWPTNVVFDISHVEGIGGVGSLASAVGAEHIVLGTHSPLLIAESALLKVREADLSEADRELILHGNAERIVGG